MTTTLISAGQDNVRLNMTGLQHGLVGCFLCLSSLTQGPYGTSTSSPMHALTSFSQPLCLKPDLLISRTIAVDDFLKFTPCLSWISACIAVLTLRWPTWAVELASPILVHLNSHYGHFHLYFRLSCSICLQGTTLAKLAYSKLFGELLHLIKSAS